MISGLYGIQARIGISSFARFDAWRSVIETPFGPL